MMINSILFIRIQHKMSEIYSRRNSENQSFPLQQRSSKNDNQSEELPQPPMIDILSLDLLLRIMKHAPQIGTTCK